MNINKIITNPGRLFMMFAMAAVFACAPEAKPEQNSGKHIDANDGEKVLYGSVIILRAISLSFED